VRSQTLEFSRSRSGNIISRMTADRVNGLIWVVFAWIGVIFFSSTSLASKWAEGSFGLLSRALLGQMDEHSSSYSVIHLLTDKGFHVTLFCVLAILLWLAVHQSKHKGRIILLVGAVVGSCSEILQRFFPDRDPAIRDVLINIGGTALGIGICLLLSRIQTQRGEQPASA
jgi:VanZ family protein